MAEDLENMSLAELRAMREKVANSSPEESSSEQTSFEVDPAVQNIIDVAFPMALSPMAIRGVINLGKKAVHKVGQFINPKNFLDNAKLAKLKQNPDLKKKVTEVLGEQAGGRRIGQVSNKEAGILAQKAADDYKAKHQVAAAAAYKIPTEALEKFTEGHTSSNRLVSISNVLGPLVEHYHGLEEPAAKAIFLATPAGKKMIAALGGVQDVKLPSRKNASIVQKVDHLLRNPDIVEGRLMPIKTAEALKQDIGDLLKNKELFGTSQQRKLSMAYDSTKEAIDEIYKKAGAEDAWNAANELVSEHHKKRAPIANAIASHGKTKPVGSFKEVHSGLGEDALARDFVSSNLDLPDRQTFSRGTVFELGKEGNAFNADRFNKNFSNLSRETQSNILRDLDSQDQGNIGALLKRLKTMGELESKKGKAEIVGEFLPNWLQKIAINPVKKMRYNVHANPNYVNKTVEALKKKAHPSAPKISRESLDIRGMPGLYSGLKNKEDDLNNLSLDELKRMRSEIEEHD